MALQLITEHEQLVKEDQGEAEPLRRRCMYSVPVLHRIFAIAIKFPSHSSASITLRARNGRYVARSRITLGVEIPHTITSSNIPKNIWPSLVRFATSLINCKGRVEGLSVLTGSVSIQLRIGFCCAEAGTYPNRKYSILYARSGPCPIEEIGFPIFGSTYMYLSSRCLAALARFTMQASS